MSDAVVPSYRVHREPSALPWRMMAAAGGVVGVLALGGAGYWAFGKMGGRSVPVVEADPRPFKIRPADAGGLRVPNQNELVLERPGQRVQSPAQAGRGAALAPPAEAPNIDGLRAAVQPPAPPARQAPPSPAATAPAAAPAAIAPVPAPAATPIVATMPAPATPARIAVSGRAQVQLGALGSEDAARAEWERLNRRAPELFQGRTPTIVRLEREGQAPLFRLRTSGLADLDTAGQFCEQVKARGGNCVPVR
jgi:hypothetical protein